MAMDRFKIIAILTLISFILSLIGLVSPYWIQKKYGTGNKFSNIGLWEVCWDGFVHKTFYQQAFYGCFFIYYYKFENFQSWLTPSWFPAIQFIYTLGFLCQWLAVMICICQFLNLIHRTSKPTIKAFIIAHIISGVCKLISCITIGSQSANKDWLPEPDTNALSFAFASALLSFCFSIAAVVLSVLRLRFIIPSKSIPASASDYQGQSVYAASTYAPTKSIKASSMVSY